MPTCRPRTFVPTRNARTRALPATSAAASRRTRPPSRSTRPIRATSLISQNDYREGDGHCGVDWSIDGGKHWGSQLAPMGFGLPILDNGGVRHYWTSGGDTSVAFDSTGEAYLMCQVFDRGFATDERGPLSPFGASAFMIFRSADGGASWSFPGDYVVTTGGGEDPNATIGLLDKEYMTIDNNPSSPHKDRIYVTWSNYSPDFTADPIEISVLGRPRSDVERGRRHQRVLRRPLPDQLQRRGGGHVRLEPVLGAVRRPQRRPVRGVLQLQQLRGRACSCKGSTARATSTTTTTRSSS